MSLATIVQDIRQVAADLGPILEALAGKSAAASVAGGVPTAPAESGGVDVGLDVVPVATAALGTITAVTNSFAAYQADLQAPAMVNASVAEKLQAFRDRINKDLATGNEADLETLEASR